MQAVFGEIGEFDFVSKIVPVYIGIGTSRSSPSYHHVFVELRSHFGSCGVYDNSGRDVTPCQAIDCLAFHEVIRQVVSIFVFPHGQQQGAS